MKCCRQLNTCLVHFINVGKLYNLVMDEHAKPIQPSINLWALHNVLLKVKDVESTGTTAVGATVSGNGA